MNFDFKRLAEADFTLLFDWLNRAHVAEWFGGSITSRGVEDKFLPLLSATSTIHPFVASVNGTPVGFIQSYVVIAQRSSGWWPDERDAGAIGIDQFIADAENLGKGLGTEMVCQFIEFLFQNPAVTKIQTDPAPNNFRAIRCYEKAGFRKAGIIDTPAGPAQLMVIARAEKNP